MRVNLPDWMPQYVRFKILSKNWECDKLRRLHIVYLQAWARRHVHSHSCGRQWWAESPSMLIGWSYWRPFHRAKQSDAWQRVEFCAGLCSRVSSQKGKSS